LNGDFNAEDDIWDEFNDSVKLKNNLEVLLVCKKMNLHFEVCLKNKIENRFLQ